MKEQYNATVEGIPRAGSTRKNTVLVPTGMVPSTGYPRRTRLKFGLKEKVVNLIPVRNTRKVRLSKDLIEELNIPEGMDICVKYKNGTLSLGPVVGIFINDLAFESLSEGYAGNKIKRLVEAAHQAHVFAYFFTSDNVVWSDLSTDGVIYNHNTGEWENRQVPLPNVLYDRGGGFSRHGLIRAMEIRKQLNHFKDLKKINAQHYFDKWDLHCKLSKHEDMKQYLPDTMLYEDIDTLKTMTEKYDVVYLKSCTGSNGREVIRVRKLDSSMYEYDYYKRGVVKKKTDSLYDIARAARRLMSERSFIVQQGLESLTHNGNKVDLRALVQRNHEGTWALTCLPVRIAVDDCPVTSTKSGSNVYKFEEAFTEILGFSSKQTDEVKKKIVKLLFAAIDAIQEEYGTFGELGIDILIDNDLNPWFIESNSKPAKDTIIKSGTPEDIEKAYKQPFEYSKYLSGFYDNTGK